MVPKLDAPPFEPLKMLLNIPQINKYPAYAEKNPTTINNQ
jgi:hypothetical protein